MVLRVCGMPKNHTFANSFKKTISSIYDYRKMKENKDVSLLTLRKICLTLSTEISELVNFKFKNINWDLSANQLFNSKVTSPFKK